MQTQIRLLTLNSIKWVKTSSKFRDYVDDCLFPSPAIIQDVMAHYILSLNSRRHTVVIFSARVEEARFRMRVTLGVFLIRSLVCTKHVPGHLRSGSGVALD